jgi:UDP-2,3-diacylglucosamine pyrophosphatase LpxH
MSLFCISDLHLGNRGFRDNFAQNEGAFFRFLDYVEQQQGLLLILGDLLETWQFNFSDCVVANQKLLRTLCCTGPDGARWVLGNHDATLTQFLGTDIQLIHANLPSMSGPFEHVIGGKKFAFLHGHESDPYCRDLSPGMGELTAIMSAMLEDKNRGTNADGRAVEDGFIASLEWPLNIWRKITAGRSRRDEMLDLVESYRQEKLADVVVYGHTHEQGRIGNHHYNCGCWCRDHNGFTRIESDGTVGLFEWRDNKAIPFDKELR